MLTSGALGTKGKLGTSKVQIPCLHCLLVRKRRGSLRECTPTIYKSNARILHYCYLSCAVNYLSTECVDSWHNPIVCTVATPS